MDAGRAYKKHGWHDFNDSYADKAAIGGTSGFGANHKKPKKRGTRLRYRGYGSQYTSSSQGSSARGASANAITPPVAMIHTTGEADKIAHPIRMPILATYCGLRDRW